MLKRIVLGAAMIAGSSTATWKGAGVGEYFGRVDVNTWASEHPAAAAPAVELGKHRVRVSDTRRIAGLRRALVRALTGD